MLKGMKQPNVCPERLSLKKHSEIVYVCVCEAAEVLLSFHISECCRFTDYLSCSVCVLHCHLEEMLFSEYFSEVSPCKH